MQHSSDPQTRRKYHCGARSGSPACKHRACLPCCCCCCCCAGKASLAVVSVILLCAANVSGNTTYCWGNGAGGTLGDGRGSSGAYAWPLPTAVIDAPEFAIVSAGERHTCALTAAGKAYCWVSHVGRKGGQGCGQQCLHRRMPDQWRYFNKGSRSGELANAPAPTQ